MAKYSKISAKDAKKVSKEKSIEKSKEVAEEILKESTNYATKSSTKSSAQTQKPTSAGNPLNPKTSENLNQGAFLEKTLGRKVSVGKTTGKRWISIQAWNLNMLNNGNQQASSVWSSNHDYGLIIATTKQPTNGVGYDPVILVEDITLSYPGAFLNTPTVHIDTVDTGGTFELRYKETAFQGSVGGVTNIVNTNGAYYINLRVTFLSGHVEKFEIFAPIGESYNSQLPSGLSGSGITNAATNILEVKSCENKPSAEFYSKGMNILNQRSTWDEDFGILTRYKSKGTNPDRPGEFNPSGTLGSPGLYVVYPMDENVDGSGQAPLYPFINAINGGFQDPLANLLGVDGIVTPAQQITGRQEFHRIDINLKSTPNLGVTEYSMFVTNSPAADFNAFQTAWTPYPGGVNDYDAWYVDNDDDMPMGASTLPISTDLDSIIAPNVVGGSLQPHPFVYTIYYAENITSCGGGALINEYDVCSTTGNPSNFLITGLDCNGNTIPSADMPGGANHVNGLSSFNNLSTCCTDCGNFNVNTIKVDPTFGNSDGYIEWDARVGGASSGDPFNTGSEYTVTIKDAFNADAGGTAAPTGGNTVTVASTVSDSTGIADRIVFGSGNAQIVPGMKIASGHTFYTAASGTSIPTTAFVGEVITGNLSVDATEYYIVDSLGNPAYSQADATPNLVFQTGNYGKHGGLAENTAANPFYVVCVKDETGCEECSNQVLNQPAGPPAGCTDSTAVNYDSSASIDDGSCILCNATSGLLEDPGGSNATNLFENFTFSSNAATWNSGVGSATTHNSDGTLSITSNVIAAAIPYLTYDANSKYEVLIFSVPNFGDPVSSGTQVGSTINAGTTLSTGIIAATTKTGLPYGYYTIRVRYVDTNTVSTMENCFSDFHAKVKAQVCTDTLSPDFMSVPSAINLQEQQNALLCTSAYDCCVLDPIQYATALFDPCSPILNTTITCSPSRAVQSEWFYSPDGITYTSILITQHGMVIAPETIIAQDPGVLTNLFSVTGSGFYKVVATCTLFSNNSNQTGLTVIDTCVEETEAYFDWPLHGCMDSTAYNFDATAVCPGPCISQSWDCDGNGNCTDPGTGLGAFMCDTPGNPLCCNTITCPVPVLYGCTDPCASNYNSTANTDDGSCMYTACLDPMAINQYMNCCSFGLGQGIYIPITSISGPDNSCCITPCAFPHDLSTTTTDATGTCTSFISDGTVTLTLDAVNYNININTYSWTWQIYDVTQTTIIYSDPTVYTGQTTSAPYSSLGTGNFWAEITDNFGCVFSISFWIGSTSQNVGCMNPDADNYDPLAICDCGCCLICGCLDPNASNFNPNANVLCECEYNINPAGPNACIPPSLEEDLEKLRACLSIKGTDWLTDYTTGRTTECLIMDKWKLIFIEYLLSVESEGIDCLFNCADVRTPNATVADCNSLWVTGGNSTGLNHDPNHEGASIAVGEGTTITAYDGFPLGWFGYDGALTPNPTSNYSYVGDVIKFNLDTGHPLSEWLNGTIWTLTQIPPNAQGLHQGCKTSEIGHYTQCLDYSTFSITGTTNYYDNFINFVNKFCQDCNISILK